MRAILEGRRLSGHEKQNQKALHWRATSGKVEKERIAVVVRVAPLRGIMKPCVFSCKLKQQAVGPATLCKQKTNDERLQ